VGWGLKVERPKRDQKGVACGAVMFGRVKMARVEVRLLFRFIGVCGRARVCVCVGKDGFFNNIGYRDAAV